MPKGRGKMKDRLTDGNSINVQYRADSHHKSSAYSHAHSQSRGRGSGLDPLSPSSFFFGGFPLL
jgi:hypothetical protein